MTASADPARRLLDPAVELDRLRAHRELLQRQQQQQSTGPSYLIVETAREINDTRIVEGWLARQLRELPGGER